MSLSHDDVVNYLSNLSVMDIVKLTKELEDKWGVKAAPVAVAAAGGGGVQAGTVASSTRLQRRGTAAKAD